MGGKRSSILGMGLFKRDGTNMTSIRLGSPEKMWRTDTPNYGSNLLKQADES